MGSSVGARAVRIVAMAAGALFGLWMLAVTWTAFFGGKAPFFPWSFTGGNVVRGLIWVVVAVPIISIVANVVFSFVVLPLAALFERPAPARVMSETRAGGVADAPPDASRAAHRGTVIDVRGRVGSLHLYLEADTGPGTLRLGSDGRAAFFTDHGVNWDLGLLAQSVSDFEVRSDGRVMVGFRPPIPLMFWGDAAEAAPVLELLRSQGVRERAEGEPL